MDGLRGLLAKKKAEMQAEKAEIPGKYVKRSALEEKELKRRREEEEEDHNRKMALLRERKKRHGVKESASETERAVQEGTPNDASTSVVVPPEILALSPDEVTRRLRLLKEPKRLFGETERDRLVRLVLAEKSFRVTEEDAGGQQANLHLLFERQEKEAAQKKMNETADRNDTGPTEAGTAATAGNQATSEDNELMASFKRAAEAAAELTMSTEDIINKRIKNWMAEWADELTRRSPEEKATAAGKQADVRYKETKEYFRPLHTRLQKKTIDTDLLAGLKIITDAMKERNYLHAYKIYMGVAIGNSPWPIGVTHIGLHERANRERIGHKKNEQGKTHIMADEASRKYIQALKRLMTFVQRRYPTDPSRCMDFDANNSLGDSRSNKLLLLEAEAAGDKATSQSKPVPLPQAESWQNVVRAELRKQHGRKA